MILDFLQSLLKKGIISEDQFNFLIKESEEKSLSVEELIIENKILPEKDFFRYKSEFFNIPFIEIPPENISPDVLKIISEDAANNYKIIPLKLKENLLEVGIVNPDDISARSALDFIAQKRGAKLKIYLLSLSNFNEIIKQYHLLKTEVEEAIKEWEKEKEEEVPLKKKEKEIEKIVEEAPISKIVSVVLRNAVEGKASDIHIEPFGEKLRVRFRLDGILHSSIFLDKKILPQIISKIKILANLRIDETRKPQDGRFTDQISGRRIDFRVATLPTAQGEKAVLRILDPLTTVIGGELEDLGFIGRNLRVLKEASKLPFGSIVFCGPTGSGKSTSQYAILQDLNTEGVNIVTLEDPVEYWIDGINQSQVMPEIGYTFAQGLRQIVRQDPDIIMVGEVRDRETADLVTHAALTGHLVLFTLHTNNATGAIPRLLDLGVEAFLIPPTIKIVVAQRLVRRLCSECKEKVKANKEEEKIITEEMEKISEKEKKIMKVPTKDFYLYKPKGCPECLQKGTKGRIGIFEILTMTDEISDIILREPSESHIEKEAIRQGMITMKQDGIIKALLGMISLEETLKTIEMKEKFE